MKRLFTKKKIFYCFIITLVLVMLLSIKIGVKPAHAVSPISPNIKTVFIIMMENHTWSQIKGSSAAPYINNTLLPMSAHAEQYYNPPGNHPSEPNYLWLEAGTNFGITNDNNPSANHQSTTNHLVTLLTKAGLTWKAYQEDIPGTNCPLTNIGNYAVRHEPFTYFDDVTNNLSPTSQNCIQHIRPYSELSGDLVSNTVANYNFLTPNICNDMHSCSVQTGDTWLQNEVPKILNSQAYKNGGVVFITWDEGEKGSDGPIGMIVLSPFAKKNYTSNVHYDHSSTLKTIEEIFGVSPLLGGAANANDLGDLFGTSIPTTPPTLVPTKSVTTIPTKTVTPAPTTAPCPSFPTSTGVVTNTLTVKTAGEYTVWSRILAPTTNPASYYLQIDNRCGIKVGGATGVSPNVWTWVNYEGGVTTNKIILSLSQGSHLVKLIGNTPNLGLDRIIFTSDMTCTPVGFGNNCVQTVTPTVSIAATQTPVTPTPEVSSAPSTVPSVTIATTVIPTIAVSSIPTITPFPTSIPTIIPTNTPAPTATPVPGTQFAVTVLVHGIGHGGDNAAPDSWGNRRPVHPQRVLGIEVFDSNNNLVASPTGTVTFDPVDGSYKGIISVGYPLPAGPYLTKFVLSHHLQKSLFRIITLQIGQPQPVVLPTVTMSTGDIIGNGNISVLDYNALLDCFEDFGPSRNCPVAALKESSDLNDDGKVDLFDLNLFLREITVQSGQ